VVQEVLRVALVVQVVPVLVEPEVLRVALVVQVVPVLVGLAVVLVVLAVCFHRRFPQSLQFLHPSTWDIVATMLDVV
jgi:hypothetical protein